MKKKIAASFLVMFFSVGFLFAQTSKGFASYYANKFQGRKTASGERYSHKKYTAAHRKLKFGTKVKVTNLKTGVWVIVRINDRGPYSKKFLIDLSLIAAKKLNLHKTDAKVKMEVLEEVPNKK
jgi:rare lipoprotein A